MLGPRKRRSSFGVPPTEKQKAARDRNWKVFKLRGLYWCLWPLTGERLAAAREAIDAELAMLNAEPETPRHKRLVEERAREWEEEQRYHRFRKALIGDMQI